jgi:hypothetical protein
MAIEIGDSYDFTSNPVVQTVGLIHDPEGRYQGLLDRNARELMTFFPGCIIPCSTKTHEGIKTTLTAMGFFLAEGGLFGEARMNGVRSALVNPNTETIAVFQMDKMAHWFEERKYVHELAKVLATPTEHDVFHPGRTQRAWSTYPQSWVQTEQPANDLLNSALKTERRPVDAITGEVVISRRAAQLFVQQSIERDFGIIFEWALLAHQAGMKVGGRKLNGLSFEDADRFQDLIETYGGEAQWREKIYNSEAEWTKRRGFLTIYQGVLDRVVNGK